MSDAVETGESVADLLAIYNGSDGEATAALYRRVERLGAAGIIAVNLFRAEKASARAKVYRGGERGRGSYKSMAYERKQWAMDNLGRVLEQHAAALGIRFGWGEDPARDPHRFVLYVEIPSGQMSFHSAARGKGPDFAGAWDGVRHQGPKRICRWMSELLGAGITNEREDGTTAGHDDRRAEPGEASATASRSPSTEATA